MGSIMKRGKSYRVQISYYSNGRHNRISRTFKTIKEAKRWELEQEFYKSNGKQLAKGNTPFAEFYSNWVYVVKKRDIRESTLKNYETSISIVKKLFGSVQLGKLNEIIVQHKLDQYAENRAKSTTKDLMTKIREALKYAYIRGYIISDFTSLLKARGKILPPRNIALCKSEASKLQSYLFNNSEDEFHVYLLVALETGMRRSEVLGIRKEHLYKYGIHVQESISPDSNDTLLKTQGSKRFVDISKRTYNLLQNISTKKDGYLFESQGFKQAERLKKLLKYLNITKTTVQGLRATHATLLYSDSINDKYISRRLGHTNTNTTHQYYIDFPTEEMDKNNKKTLEIFSNL